MDDKNLTSNRIGNEENQSLVEGTTHRMVVNAMVSPRLDAITQTDRVQRIRLTWDCFILLKRNGVVSLQTKHDQPTLTLLT